MNKTLAFRATNWLATAPWVLIAVFAMSAANAASRNGVDDAAASASGRVALLGHVLPALATATLDQSKSKAITDDEPLILTVVLNRTDPGGFAEYLRDVYDPASPAFRKFLTPTQVSDRFGPHREDYDLVKAYFVDRGLVVGAETANRLTLGVSGTRGSVEQVLGSSIVDYQIEGRAFRANSTDPVLPEAIASRLKGVVGLSDLALPGQSILGRAHLNPASANQGLIASLICLAASSLYKFLGTLALADYFNHTKNCIKWAKDKSGGPPSASAGGSKLSEVLRNAAGKIFGSEALSRQKSGPVAWQSVDGSGQKIGIVAFDNYVLSDLVDTVALYGMPPARIGQVSQVHVGGGATPGVNQSEVLLDVVLPLFIASGATVVVFDAPLSSSFQAVFNAMISDGVSIISNSWSYCEDQTTLADVQSLDAIFQTAAASGISALNASGDSGSTCLNGHPNVVGVPASAPFGTSVGGTTSVPTDGLFTYGTERWWGAGAQTPPTGKGGFGTSRFFARPTFQDGLTGSAMRSVPDIALDADPVTAGIPLCIASNGGCPTGSLYGGTSMSAPMMASFVALLNHGLTTNLGFLNTALYPLAETDAFRSSASMGSDFAHVGLGAPSLGAMHAALAGAPASPVNGLTSVVNVVPVSPSRVGADGVAYGVVGVILLNASGHPVSGKMVSLSASPSATATISPATAVTDSNGAAVFTVTNQAVEAVTLTATDVTDGLTLADTVTINFVPPPAAGGSIVALSGTAAADGVSTDTITVTLQDSLGRASPGKLVYLSQAGSSVIKGPSPSVTNSSGQIQFMVTNTKQENVFYAAFDVTDGDLRVPGGTTVNFNASGGDNCGNTNMGDPNITAAPGYALTPFAIGFVPKISNYGGLTNGCRGASGIAFDPVGDLYVSDLHTGHIYKFGAAGGVAGSATRVTTTPLGPGLEALSFGLDGKLYGAQNATTGNFFTGAVVEINPVTGSVVRTVAPLITCASFLATDPLSGDLFVDDSCSGAGSDNGSIWRINNPGSGSPTTTVYATTPGVNGGLTFSTGGTLYVLSYTQNGVARIGGTNTPQPAQITVLPGITGPALNIVALGAQPNGDAKTLLVSNVTDPAGFPAGIKAFDVTTNPATTTSLLVNNAYANVQLTGPDGCQYASMSVAVYKITNADGSCPLVLTAPSLSLSPPVVRPDPAQGTSRSFTASFHYVNVPAGTPVHFTVYGANTLQRLVNTDAAGKATMSYAAQNAGTDTVFAFAAVNSTTFTSNAAKVNWVNGQHTTSLNLNASPVAGIAGTRATLTASLFDLSVTPAAAIVGATVNLAVGSQSCNAVTNASGIASCFLILSTVGNFTLTASFTGTAQNASATASISFVVSAPRSLDVDGNGSVDALTDGLLLVRWLSNRTGSALVNRAIGLGAERVISADVIAYLTALTPMLDIDGNGQFDGPTDGLLIIRYLTGFRGDELVENAVGAGATRSSGADVAAYIQSLLP